MSTFLPALPLPAHPPRETHSAQAGLTLAALGIVFGDLGTSPLYTFHECLAEGRGVDVDPVSVLGVLSLIFWSIMFVISFKYILVLMRADHHGEGGIMALLAQTPRYHRDPPPGRIGLVALMVLAGAGLLYGDGIITPAISVLSAMEGLEVSASGLHAAVLPLTVVVLVALFAVQRHGTAGLGQAFGPVMLVWFLTAGGLGLVQLMRHPGVLAALSPHYAVAFFLRHGPGGITVLGGVVLCVTGGEALYADMGHFGRRPIQRAWFLICLPCLLLCYFGQGAAVLANPAFAEHPFFSLCPRGAAVIPFVVLAAMATVIASQALITGVFSLTTQAMHLEFFPRLRVLHTSDQHRGQIYVPALNWAMAVACIALVLGFRRSAALAAAFGLAVSGTMLLTSLVFFVVARRTWRWPVWQAGGLLALFLAVDIPFLLGNGLKFMEGGYLPFLVGVGFVLVMSNWRIGRGLLKQHLQSHSRSLEAFLEDLAEQPPSRIPGTGIFLTAAPQDIPPVVTQLVGRFRCLPERAVLVTVVTSDQASVLPVDRARVERLGPGLYRVLLHFGFADQPDVPAALAPVLAALPAPASGPGEVYLLGDERFTEGPGGRLGRVSEGMFSFLSRNASKVWMYYGLPPEKVVALQAYIEL